VQAEKLKQTLGQLTIREFGFNLVKFHNRFHSMVEQIEAMGEEVPENILSMFYQDACLAHRDLKHLTQDEQKRLGKTYDELFNEYQHALGRLAIANDKNRMPSKGKAKATRFKGKCNHCGKNGHKEDICWEKFPDKKPEWAKKNEDQ
jgi:hypothetical protein